MIHTFASLLMIAGLLASCAYFGIGLYEKLLLAKISRKERPRWILHSTFQNRLGHLAMIASIGNLTGYMVQRSIGSKHAWMILGIVIFFFFAGINRFGNAWFTRLVTEARSKQSSKP